MDDEAALGLAAAGRRDFDLSSTAKQSEPPPGRAVTQQRLRSARKDGSQVTRVLRERPMADGVDASVQTPQALRFQPPKDRLASEAQLRQLAPRHHPMLPARQRRQLRIPRVWAPICTICVTVGAHTAMLADPVRPVGYVRNSLGTMARSNP